MKFIIGVTTFAASQLQIANLMIRGPEFKITNLKPVPRSELKIKLPKIVLEKRVYATGFFCMSLIVLLQLVLKNAKMKASVTAY